MTIRPLPPRSAMVAEMLMHRIPSGAAYKQLTLSCVRKKITQPFVRWPLETHTRVRWLENQRLCAKRSEPRRGDGSIGEVWASISCTCFHYFLLARVVRSLQNSLTIERYIEVLQMGCFKKKKKIAIEAGGVTRCKKAGESFKGTYP